MQTSLMSACGRLVTAVPLKAIVKALIEQFRLPALASGEEPVMTECPAGLLEPDEDPLEAARRELEEETGLPCRRVLRMGEFMLMQGGCDEKLHFHLAQVALDDAEHPPRGPAHEGEETQVVVVDAAEAFAMVADNRIRAGRFTMGPLTVERPLITLMDPRQQGHGDDDHDGILGLHWASLLNWSTDIQGARLWAQRNQRVETPESYLLSSGNEYFSSLFEAEKAPPGP